MKNYGLGLSQPTKPAVALKVIKNNAGGYGFALSDWERFKQFITIGTETSTYYVNEQKLTQQFAQTTIKVIQADPLRAAVEIIDVLVRGRAPKRNAALFALSMVINPKIVDNPDARNAVYKEFPRIFSIATDLFIFMGYVKQQRGKGGQGLQRAISRWYTEMSLEKLALQVAKYPSREGWSHRDLLRIARPGTKGRAAFDSLEKVAVIKWALSKDKYNHDFFNLAPNPIGRLEIPLPEFIRTINLIHRDKPPTEVVVSLINEFKLPREVLPTEYLKEASVWEALTNTMAMMATIRNLGNLGAVGLLDKSQPAQTTILDRLKDTTAVERARIHPFQVMLAAQTYGNGRGDKGSKTWPVRQEVLSAMDETIKASLRNPIPTGKKILVARDVSGSMSRVLTEATILTYLMKEIEPNSVVYDFDTTIKASSVANAKSLKEALLNQPRGGGTNTSLPLEKALSIGGFDAVVMITDNESWANAYRSNALDVINTIRAKNPNFQVVEIQVSPSTSVTTLPSDPLNLQVIGFDGSVFDVISNFLQES